MSRNYSLKIGDDARELAILLTHNRAELDVQPESAQLLINVGGTVIERDLELSGDTWRYRFTDDDWAAFPAGSYTAEVYAVMDDGSNLTFPTKGTLTITFLARIE